MTTTGGVGTGVLGMSRLYPPFVRERGALGLFVVRLIAGAALVLHGWPKIQNPFNWMQPGTNTPGFLQALAALAEFGGGLALIVGLLTPVAAVGIIFTFLVAILNVQLPQGAPFVSNQGGPSFETAALHLGIAVMLLFTGPGAFALDAFLFDRKRQVP